MDSSSDKPTSRAARLKAAGLRATAPRLALLEVLEEHQGHPSADMIFDEIRERHPSISRSTVYKTLECFLEVGLCRRVHADAGVMRVDGTPDDHLHAVCRGCGGIYDIERALVPLPNPPATLPEGLRVTGLKLELEVLCPRCAGEPGQAARSAPREGDPGLSTK